MDCNDGTPAPSTSILTHEGLFFVYLLSLDIPILYLLKDDSSGTNTRVTLTLPTLCHEGDHFHILFSIKRVIFFQCEIVFPLGLNECLFCSFLSVPVWGYRT